MNLVSFTVKFRVISGQKKIPLITRNFAKKKTANQYELFISV